MNATELDAVEALYDEATFHGRFGHLIDEAALQFMHGQNVWKVNDAEHFEQLLGDCYAAALLAIGEGAPSELVARSKGKQIVDEEYRDKGLSLKNAFHDAHEGRNGGLRAILNILTDAVKSECQTNFINDGFDRIVSRYRWPEKVAFMQQVMARYSNVIDPDVVRGGPEHVAHDYRHFVQAILRAKQHAGRTTRRA